MRAKSRIARKLAAGADEVWAALEGFGGLDTWFPSIASCRVEGSGVGARRFMELEGVGPITDVLVELDGPGRRLVYDRPESPFPVSSYRGTVEVFASYDGLAVVAWTVDFEGDEEVVELVDQLLVDGIGAGIDGLGNDLEGQAGAGT
ncbi:MAG TPA: SRPBCC family protein [Iamia sp.]